MNLQHLNIKVTVKIAEVIDALMANQMTHIEQYEEARVAYFKQLQAQLSELYGDAEEHVLRPDNYAIRLVPPVNASKMYDQYIEMLTLAQEDTMVITTQEYQCFFADEWSWAQSAKLINSTYSNRGY
jgi:hypothetical protein